ncbi:MFS transporter [Streptomyces catenulae]|uniref:MFS transporter n=1 Tax=Streptomyces catenulae TaxID=66875 RepID=A0ABV2Z046_9ACTN|nr:MFS transporter [Streptomyces catenulae]
MTSVTEQPPAPGGAGRYRRLFAVPGVARCVLLMFVARLPVTAMGLTLTLHVVSGLGRGYVAAGLVGTSTTIGTMLGAPLVGRALDRHGLRPVLAVCGTVATVYWISTPWLPYEVLLVAALPAGALVVPVSSLSRQMLTALVPDEQRRTAFSADAVAMETSFVVGPAVAVFAAATWSSRIVLTTIGAVVALTALLLYLQNPPLRRSGEAAAPLPGGRRSWFDSRMAATLLVSTGVLFVLGGTELALIAALRASGDVAWTGTAIAIMALASIVGGIAHGAVRRSLPQSVLITLLAVLVIPVGLITGPWWLVGLALVPMQLVCAPTLATISESVSRIAPPYARGAAMGLLDAATRLGGALSSPLIGLVIDRSTPGWGFAASGLGGLVFVAVAAVCTGGARLGPSRGKPLSDTPLEVNR